MTPEQFMICLEFQGKVIEVQENTYQAVEIEMKDPQSIYVKQSGSVLTLTLGNENEGEDFVVIVKNTHHLLVPAMWARATTTMSLFNHLPNELSESVFNKIPSCFELEKMDEPNGKYKYVLFTDNGFKVTEFETVWEAKMFSNYLIETGFYSSDWGMFKLEYPAYLDLRSLFNSCVFPLFRLMPQSLRKLAHLRLAYMPPSVH